MIAQHIECGNCGLDFRHNSLPGEVITPCPSCGVSVEVREKEKLEAGLPCEVSNLTPPLPVVVDRPTVSATNRRSDFKRSNRRMVFLYIGGLGGLAWLANFQAPPSVWSAIHYLGLVVAVSCGCTIFIGAIRKEKKSSGFLRLAVAALAIATAFCWSQVDTYRMNWKSGSTSYHDTRKRWTGDLSYRAIDIRDDRRKLSMSAQGKMSAAENRTASGNTPTGKLQHSLIDGLSFGISTAMRSPKESGTSATADE